MYTVLWTCGDHDYWDRFDFKEEVIQLVSELEKRIDVDMDSVLIFTPDAEDYLYDVDTFGEESE